VEETTTGSVDDGKERKRKEDVFFSSVEVSFNYFWFWFFGSALLGGSIVQNEKKIKFLL